MISLKRLSVHAALALVAGSITSLALAQTAFTSSYRGGSTASCSTTYAISGVEPSGTGKYPVYVHTVGTIEPYDSAWAMAAVNAMAAKGFVAATIQYDNGSFGSCSTLGTRAKCIFDESKASSAIQALCSRGKADCSKGIVTGGFSQGSVLSVLSKNYDSRIRASMGQGSGTAYNGFEDLQACMSEGNRAQPGNRLRIANGEHDIFVGPTAAIARGNAERVTGFRCTGDATQCLQSNGSGWMIVKDQELIDRYADHCFMGVSGYGVQCLGILTVDSNYQYGSAPWALPATTDWLKTFVTP